MSVPKYHQLFNPVLEAIQRLGGSAKIAEMDNAVIESLAPSDLTIRREIVWKSASATDSEVNAKEVELIRANRANDPTIGYNQGPKFKLPR
jgi:hypothetical protein